MNFQLLLQLLLHTSLTSAIPALNGVLGKFVMGPEALVTDFAVFNDDEVGDQDLPDEITVCSSVQSAAFTSGLAPFQLFYENGKPWVTVYFYGALKESKIHRMIFFVGDITIASVVTEIPVISLQLTWLHICVRISCNNNQISAYVNGYKVLDETHPQQPTPCPTRLNGNMLLGKYRRNVGYWAQNQGRVTNVNIFTGLMSDSEMISRTAGEDCGKSDGDFYTWSKSTWTLKGEAKWTDVTLEDLCRDFPSIQFFSTGRVIYPTQCSHICKNMHALGRMTSVETNEHFDRLKARSRWLNPRMNGDGTNPISVWLPVSRHDGVWRDDYTNNIVSMDWNKGFPVDDPKKSCTVGSLGMVNYFCINTGGLGGFYCSCDFVEHPFLTLRGLCKDSYLDQTYLPQNGPVDGETTYYGNRISFAKFLKDELQWRIATSVYNITAMSKEIPGRMMLGKQTWTVEGDSKKCFDGKTYQTELKLSRCKEGEFTCANGQCIKMEKRCDQVTGKEPNCRDKSDENGCELIIFENNYNKNIPPFEETINEKGEEVAQTNVRISITLMKVVEIEEVDHSIHIQFMISMQWKENRVNYHNLKKKTSLNALAEKDVNKLWLPLVVYDNTDQKQTTRLGEFGNGEWITRVTVTREGNFTRNGVDEVDEAEIFEGAENRLTMNQTYTHEFQCQYELQRYPFDLQECKIKMTVESLAYETVALAADQVLMNDISSLPKDFADLTYEDTDLTMFIMTELVLKKDPNGNMVYMALKLKRKVATELLTTYLPTVLLLLITFVTIFFDKSLFGDAIAVNLTIMLVMTTIFTSKIMELPPTSDMKMIDIWLIFCLVVPFLEVVLRTAIECLNCECQICEPKEPKNMQAWAITGNKEMEESSYDKNKGGNIPVVGGKCNLWMRRRVLEITEMWVLPILVLIVSVAYTILATTFYNTA